MRPQYDYPLPIQLRDRPRDERGYIIPWFVAKIGDDGIEVEEHQPGTYDFRVSSRFKFGKAVTLKLCWLCGKPVGRFKSFVIGPMCAVTRTTSEPPCHLACARYAAIVCPFLSRPRMRRNEVDMPESHVAAPGLTISRNPGVAVIWTTPRFELFRPHMNGHGQLIMVGDPTHIEWWREGRPASREEALESINSGLPILREQADKEGPAARRALETKYVPIIDTLLPS